MKRLKRSNIYLLFNFLFFIISFICGIIFYLSLKGEGIYELNSLFDLNNPWFLIYDVVFVSIAFITSFFFIGPIVLFTYLNYSFFTSGFVCYLLFDQNGLEGFKLLLIFLFIYKLLQIILMILINFYNSKLTLAIFKKYFLKEKVEFQFKFIKYIKRINVFYIILVLVNILAFFFGKYLLN